MKKSKILMLCGIGLFATALAIDVILSCTAMNLGTIAFDFKTFSRLTGDIVAIVAGYILLRYSKKAEEKGE